MLPPSDVLPSRFPPEHHARTDELVAGLQKLTIPSSDIHSGHSSPASSRAPSFWSDCTASLMRTAPNTRHTNVPQDSSRSSPCESPEMAFASTRSRVLRLSAAFRLSEHTLPDVVFRIKALQPTLWRKRQLGPTDVDGVWLVFRAHEDARLALSLSNPSFPLSPAVESDLEHIQNLQQVLWSDIVAEMPSPTALPPCPAVALPFAFRDGHLPPHYPSGSRLDIPGGLGHAIERPYHISSNPPNPKLSFRAGDWMCSVSHCAAHNFGRNSSCIRCGTPRAISNGTSNAVPGPMQNISPRFVNAASMKSNVAQSLLAPLQLPPPNMPVHKSQASPLPRSPATKAPSPLYPLLTPSGHALSAGGRVRNISTDPLAPCIMYWPDNEPLPERGQIRPFGSAVVQFPPIINTGNKGAAEKQPGDWICSKCNYLNWRRRKVCQTCYPYAEGNGDSISAAVQAERIALLANVLNRAEASLQNKPSPVTSPFDRAGAPMSDNASHAQLPPTSPHQDIDLQSKLIHPIYQTSAPSPYTPRQNVTSECNLLPSFLQDIVQESPSLSPATSYSSEIGFDDRSYVYTSSSNTSPVSSGRPRPYASSNSSTSSIWRFDGEETRNLGFSGRQTDPLADLTGKTPTNCAVFA
ncbi:hypothetical protein K474DRAFT_1674700 [Panus rudis PR-1116 ss-1]|nr:hypothetical protein K474DRAFT_1674700 [Panus rudis PR-1116 ss-1]